METIKTIDQLVEQLTAMKNDQSKKVLDIMSLVEIPQKEFERYFRWSDARYTRNVLSRTDDFEDSWFVGRKVSLLQFMISTLKKLGFIL